MDVVFKIIGAIFSAILNLIWIIISLIGAMIEEASDNREIIGEYVKHKPLWWIYCLVLASCVLIKIIHDTIFF